MSHKRKTTGAAAEAPPQVEELQLERVIGLNPHTNSVAHHPGRQEVAYCAGSVVVLYDAKSNKQRAFLSAESSSSKPFISVAYSADGSHVAAGESGSHPSVVVWDAETCACLVELKGHKHGVGAVTFSPSGKQIASCGTTYDGQVCLFAWQSKTLLGRERTQSELRSIAFSCDGGAVVSCGKNHLKIWSISQVGGRGGRGPMSKHQPSVTLSGRAPILGGFKSHTLVGVASAQASPGHGPVHIYAATSQGILLQMKSTSRSYELSVDLKVNEVFALAVSEAAVAVACSEGIVRLFAARTLAFKANLPRPAAHGDHALTDPRRSISKALRPGAAALFPDALSVAFDGCGDRLVVAYADHSVFVWDIRNPAKVGRVRSLLGHAGPIWDIGPLPPIAGSAKGTIPNARAPPPGTFATCSADGSLRLWNLEATGQDQGSTYFKPLVGAAYVQDPAQAPARLTAAEDRPVGRRPEQAPVLRCLKASPDGRHIATGDKRGNLWVFDATTQEQVAVMEAHDNDVLSLAYSPSGDTGGYLLASGGRDKVVHVYDPQLGYQRLATLDDQTGAVTAVVFADGGSRLATCSADRTITFRNLSGDGDPVEDGCERVKVPGSGALYHMHMEATERYVVSSGEDKKFKVYEVATGRHVKTFNLPEGQAGAAVKLHVDDAGITVAAAHADRCVRLYDFFTGSVLGQASGHSDVVTSCFITPDFQRLVTASGDSCIFVYRMPEKLTTDSLARAAQLAKESRPRKANAPQLEVASVAAASPSGRSSVDGSRESKRERLLVQGAQPASGGNRSGSSPLQPFDVNAEPLMSERIRQGKPLVSTRKLPKWAQGAASGLEPSPLGKPFSGDSEGTGVELPSESTLVPASQQPAGKWAERLPGPQEEGPLQLLAGHRRLTVERSEAWPVDSSSPPPGASEEGCPVSASPSHPGLADAAEAEDDIVYYSEDGEATEPADGSGSAAPEDFVITDPPEGISDDTHDENQAEGDDGLNLGPDSQDTAGADAEGGEIPRSNLFREHFGQLLEDTPLPAPSPSSREAARQSFSSQVRAVDEGTTPSSDAKGGVVPGGANATPSPAEAGGLCPEQPPGSAVDTASSIPGNSNRKGRLGKEISDMRSRLVDLGISYAKQKSMSQRPRRTSSSTAGIGENEEAAGHATTPAVSKLVSETREFCIGSPTAQAASKPFKSPFDPVKEDGNLPGGEADMKENIVKEAVGEIELQLPDASPQRRPGATRRDAAGSGGTARRNERSRLSGRNSKNSLASSRSPAQPAGGASLSPVPPPLPEGAPPPEAVSLSSSRVFESPKIVKDGASNSDLALQPGISSSAQATPQIFHGGIKFANPEFGRSPVTNPTEAGNEDAIAAAGMRRLSMNDDAASAAATQQPMAPGHQVVSVVSSSKDAPLIHHGPKEPGPKKPEGSNEKQPGPGVRLSNLLGRLKGSRSNKASPPSEHQTANKAPSAPEPVHRDSNAVVAEAAPKSLAEVPSLPEIQKGPLSAAASTESKKGLSNLRGSRIRGLRRSQDGLGAENGALAAALSSTLEPKKFTAGTQQAASVPATWATLPDGGASLQSLRAAVAEVEAMHRSLVCKAVDSESAKQQGLIGAEISQAMSKLAALGVSQPANKNDRDVTPRPGVPSPSAALSPKLPLEPSEHVAATPQLQRPVFVNDALEQSIASSSINLSELSHQVESVLENSAEKLSDRFLHLIEQKLPELLHQQQTPRPSQAENSVREEGH